LDEIRKRARLLVIDDEKFNYVQLFERDGYTIEKWDDVKDINRLETGYYDIILLDLKGVGRAEFAEQGFGILKHLRSSNPAQIIVAYSNADWPVKYQEFFRMADAVLPKQDDYADFKRAIDALLLKRFSLDFYLDKITQVAEPYVHESQRLRKISRKAILSRSTSNLEQQLQNLIENKEAIKTVLELTAAAIRIGVTIFSML
jgi:CheY-like chemotaxis protein